MWLQSFIEQTVKHLTFTFGKIAKLKTLKNNKLREKVRDCFTYG